MQLWHTSSPSVLYASQHKLIPSPLTVHGQAVGKVNGFTCTLPRARCMTSADTSWMDKGVNPIWAVRGEEEGGDWVGLAVDWDRVEQFKAISLDQQLAQKEGQEVHQQRHS